MKRPTLFVCIVSACLQLGGQAGADPVEGAILAQSLCAGCHAVGPRDISPHPAAPPFRKFAGRFDLEQAQVLLEEGALVAAHEDMPSFKLQPRAARSIFNYIRSIQE